MACTRLCIAPSPSNAHCAAEGCHITFGSVTGFDRHRRGGQCLYPAGIGMHTDRNGIWRMQGVDVTMREWPGAARVLPLAAENGPAVPGSTPDDSA
jgi:hypothetical protein